MKTRKSIFSKILNIRILYKFLFTIFWLSVIAFIGLTVLKSLSLDYQWSPYSTFSQRIDRIIDDFSRPVAVGAAALAFLTLALTTKRTASLDKQLEKTGEQINLIERQMELSYQPEILINNTDVFCTISDSKHGNSSISFQEGEKSSIPARLLFANVGRGVAKELTIRFSFDYKKAISNLQTLEISTSFYTNETIDQISVSSKDFKIDEYKCSIKSDVFGHKRNYIYSAGQGESIIRLPIPEIILLYKTKLFQTESVK